VLGVCLVFGYSSFVVGFVLMAVGVLGLIAFMFTPGTIRRPREREVIIEEKHFIGDGDDHRHCRTSPIRPPGRGRTGCHESTDGYPLFGHATRRPAGSGQGA
jgi:hypothetical protein